MRAAAWSVVLVLGLASAVYAQLPRPLPADGKFGALAGRQPYPLLAIGDETLRLAPGGRILDEQNRIIMHDYLPEQAYVLFVKDMNGDVSRVYLLRPDEVEQVKSRR